MVLSCTSRCVRVVAVPLSALTARSAVKRVGSSRSALALAPPAPACLASLFYAMGVLTRDRRITRSFGACGLPAASRSPAGQNEEDVLVVSRRSPSALLIMCPQSAPAEDSPAAT
jgi:hypothetical protein